MQHGEAVAIGMLAAARVSSKLSFLDKKELIRLRGVIAGAGLPTEVPDLKLAKIIQAIEHDKKILQGKIRFVLPKAIGSVFITDEVSLSLVEEILVNWHEET
jgi:3-dehydroquinate synthase